MSSGKGKGFDTQAAATCMAMLLFWSSGPIFIKYLTTHIDSWTQNMLRYTVAWLFWLPFFIAALTAGRVDKSIWRKAILPAIANILMQSIWAKAFYQTEPAFLDLLSKSSVLWITGFSLIFFADERALIRSKRFWTGSVLSFIGVLGVLLCKEDFMTPKTAAGIILALLSSLIWASYIISVKTFLNDVDSRSGFCVACFYTMIGLWVLGLLFGKPMQCFEMPAWPWACAIISAITSIALTHVLYYGVMKRIGATIPTLVLLSTPFGVLIFSHVLFGESLNSWQLFFGMLLIVGAGFSIWAQGHLNRPPTQENK